MSTEERIAELERRVKELEAQPREAHYHYYPPVYVQPYTPPAAPLGIPWIYTSGTADSSGAGLTPYGRTTSDTH